MNNTGETTAQVDTMARELVDKGRFDTMQQARKYIYESQPELADKVREEAGATMPATHTVKSVVLTQKPEPRTVLGAANAEVEKMATELVERGRFDTIQKARVYVFDSRPELAEQVRAETLIAPLLKKAKLNGARAEVEKAAQKLVDAREFATIQQARSHVYETEPKLAEAVRAEEA